MYLVAAFDHEGRPFGSTKVTTRDEAERAAARYIDSPKIARVSVRKVLPEHDLASRGNGRYR